MADKLKSKLFKLLVKLLFQKQSLHTEYSPNFKAPVRWCPKGECLCSLAGALLPSAERNGEIQDPLRIVWEVVPYDWKIVDLEEYIRTASVRTSEK